MDATSLAYYIGLAVVNFLAFILNSLLVTMFVVYRKKLIYDNNNNKILLAMSVANLLVGLTGTINWVIIASGESVGMYKIAIILMFSSMFGTVIILCLLTFNQLVAVIRPLRYNSLVTNQRVYNSIFSAFVFAAIFAINETIVLKFAGSNIELRVRTVFMAAVFFVGVSILAISNYKLYSAIQYQRKRLVPLTITSSSVAFNASSNIDMQHVAAGAKTAKHMRQKINFRRGAMCIWLVVIFIITWLPITSYYFSAFIGRDESIKQLIRFFLTIATINTILNPCLYFLKKELFRRFLLQMLWLRKDEVS